MVGLELNERNWESQQCHINEDLIPQNVTSKCCSAYKWRSQLTQSRSLARNSTTNVHRQWRPSGRCRVQTNWQWTAGYSTYFTQRVRTNWLWTVGYPTHFTQRVRILDRINCFYRLTLEIDELFRLILCYFHNSRSSEGLLSLLSFKLAISENSQASLFEKVQETCYFLKASASHPLQWLCFSVIQRSAIVYWIAHRDLLYRNEVREKFIQQ